jgi:hypothetical protein
MKTIEYSEPENGIFGTRAFSDYRGVDEAKTLCTYCLLKMQCEIYDANRALQNTFSIRTRIVECPRMIEDTAMEE